MSNNAPVRRSNLRFTLKTLFVLTAVLCLWLGAMVNRARRQQQTIEAIQAAGGSATYDSQFNERGDEVEGGGDDPVPAWLAKLSAAGWAPWWLVENHFEHVVGADFDGTKSPDQALEQLEALGGIRALGFSLQHEETLRRVLEFNDLQRLGLRGTALTDKGLESLSRLGHLRTLALSGKQITAQGIQSLSNLSKLEELRLDMPVNDDIAGAIAKLTQLRQLVLYDSELSAEGVHRFRRLTRLELLHLSGDLNLPRGSLHDLRDALPNLVVEIETTQGGRTDRQVLPALASGPKSPQTKARRPASPTNGSSKGNSLAPVRAFDRSMGAP